METMAKEGMSGFFATHLHDIFKLPLTPDAASRIVWKRMVFELNPNADNPYSRIEWTFKMENGVCTDSHALETAAKFGLPLKVLNRAEALALCLDADGGCVNKSTSGDSTNEIVFSCEGSNGHSPGLNDATRIAEEIIGGECNPVHIPPRWMSPPVLEGTSCLYVLEVGSNPPRYYVGETDSLAKRMSQHRKKGADWAVMRTVAFNIEGGKSDSRHLESLLIRRLSKSGFDMMSIADGRLIRKASSAEDKI